MQNIGGGRRTDPEMVRPNLPATRLGTAPRRRRTHRYRGEHRRSGSWQVPVTLRPERSEWVGELAELTRQIAALELPDGCLHPVYEALTVAINQLVHRNLFRYAGHQYSFQPHPAMVGREQHIADQLDTTTGGTSAVMDRLDAAYYRAQRRAEARMKRRFPHGF